MRASIVALSLAALMAVGGLSVVIVSDANAQATCRAKCTEDEQACLKRTNNKGQCGNTASQCLAKCK
jgi:hypothetical protein